MAKIQRFTATSRPVGGIGLSDIPVESISARGGQQVGRAVSLAGEVSQEIALQQQALRTSADISEGRTALLLDEADFQRDKNKLNPDVWVKEWKKVENASRARLNKADYTPAAKRQLAQIYDESFARKTVSVIAETNRAILTKDVKTIKANIDIAEISYVETGDAGPMAITLEEAVEAKVLQPKEATLRIAEAKAKRDDEEVKQAKNELSNAFVRLARDPQLPKKEYLNASLALIEGDVRLDGEDKILMFEQAGKVFDRVDLIRKRDLKILQDNEADDVMDRVESGEPISATEIQIKIDEKSIAPDIGKQLINAADKQFKPVKKTNSSKFIDLQDDVMDYLLDEAGTDRVRLRTSITEAGTKSLTESDAKYLNSLLDLKGKIDKEGKSVLLELQDVMDSNKSFFRVMLGTNREAITKTNRALFDWAVARTLDGKPPNKEEMVAKSMLIRPTTGRGRLLGSGTPPVALVSVIDGEDKTDKEIDDEIDALPGGTVFIDPDGVRRRKP